MENKETKDTDNKEAFKKVAIGIGLVLAILFLMGNCNGPVLPSCSSSRTTVVQSNARRSRNFRIPKPRIFRHRGRR